VIDLHDSQAGMAANEVEIVRRKQHRGPGSVDRAEQLENAARGAFIQIPGRLVAEYDERVVSQRPGDRDPLLLAARQLRRQFFRPGPTCASSLPTRARI
jgi:hypothetical protein